MTFRRYPPPGANAHSDGRLPQKPPEFRYGWYRMYEGFPTHAKWRVVAKMAGVKTGYVVAVVACILDKATKAKPRGSVVEFSVYECAANLDFENDEVARVFAALEQLGWIDRDHIATWDERQPLKEDPTNAARQARHRDRKKAQRIVAATPDLRNAVTSVTVTTRQDSDSAKQELPYSSAASGAVDSGQSEDGETAARRWLFGKVDEPGIGGKIVSIRMGLPRHHAETYLQRWLKDCGGSATLLMPIVKAADDQSVTEEAFENLINQCIREKMYELWAGPPLRFGPTIQKGGRNVG